MEDDNPFDKLMDVWLTYSTKRQLRFQRIPKNKSDIRYLAEDVIFVFEPVYDVLMRMSGNENYLKSFEDAIYDIEVQALELAKGIKIPPDLSASVMLTLNEYLEKVRSCHPTYAPYFPKLERAGEYESADRAIMIRLVFGINMFDSGSTPNLFWYVSAEAMRHCNDNGDRYVVDRIIETSHD